MSQGDYIKYKRVAVELLDQSKNLAPVIGSGQYINYKSFTLENTILNTKLSYTKLVPLSSVNVFGMQKNNPSGCASFILCSGTNSRVNRKPIMNVQFGC
jgi:mannose/fructose/N-acetylgalactosamine-specific phosphotransferase system component IIB